MTASYKKKRAGEGQESCGVCPCSDPCPIQEVVSLIGGKWKMRILCSLMVDGTLRYNDLKARTRGITPAMLSASLKELEAGGLVLRTQYEQMPVRVEYSLTEHGRQLRPILHRLAHWVRHEPFDEKEEEEEAQEAKAQEEKANG